MAVPTLITDLSTTPAANYPSGSDNVFPSLDDTLRALSAFLASVATNSPTNGYVSPYAAVTGLIYADNYATLDLALAAASAAGGGAVWLTPGTDYPRTSKLTVPDKCGLLSDGSATITASYADFNNTGTDSTSRYGSNAVVVDLSGLTIAPYTAATRTFCVGVRIVFTRAGDDRKNLVQGIVARNVADLHIEGCEITGFPVGCDIKVSSLVGGRIINNFIHDRYDNNDWTTTSYSFTVSGVTTAPNHGATYTNNGQTFTVQATNISAGSGTILAAGTGAPTASGTLTKSAGSGDATISFSANTSIAGANAYAQMTGIEFDNDVINSVYSTKTIVTGNRITDIIAGAASIAANGNVQQSDGINLAGYHGYGIVVADNRIAMVGEGIDCYMSYCTISDNVISDVYLYGLKFIHGASYNTAAGNTIYNFGLGGIVIAGTSVVGAGDAQGNTVTGGSIANGDYSQVWSASSSYAIGFVDNVGATGKPSNNYVTGVNITSGPYLKYGWYDDSTGSGKNIGDGIKFTSGAATSRSVLISGGGGACRLAGSDIYLTNSTTPSLTVSSNTIAPTNGISFVGAGLIKTITPPNWISQYGGVMYFMPTAAFTTDTTGNILSSATTAVVNRLMMARYEPVAAKWHLSY